MRVLPIELGRNVLIFFAKSSHKTLNSTSFRLAKLFWMRPITTAALPLGTSVFNAHFSAIHWDPVGDGSAELNLDIIGTISDRRKVRLESFRLKLLLSDFRNNLSKTRQPGQDLRFRETKFTTNDPLVNNDTDLDPIFSL